VCLPDFPVPFFLVELEDLARYRQPRGPAATKASSPFSLAATQHTGPEQLSKALPLRGSPRRILLY